MKRLIIFILSLLTLITVSIPAYAYWATDTILMAQHIEVEVGIGTWDWVNVEDEWNLDLWTDFDKTIPKGQIFIYKGMRWIAIRDYNPYRHGMPSLWTFIFFFRRR